MNNSKLAIDNISLEIEEQPIDRTPYLRHRMEELQKIIESLQAIKGSNHWLVLCDHIFDGVLESLQRKLSIEKDVNEMYRLQGQIAWAEKFTDLNKLMQVYIRELDSTKKQLNG